MKPPPTENQTTNRCIVSGDRGEGGTVISTRSSTAADQVDLKKQNIIKLARYLVVMDGWIYRWLSIALSLLASVLIGSRNPTTSIMRIHIHR